MTTLEPDVLSPDSRRREVVLVVSWVPTIFRKGFLPGLFWIKEGNRSGSGFQYGPGFKAWASDFPEGTRLVVTAEVILPERGGDKPCDCLAFDPVENAHTEAQHSDCGGSLHGGSLPCGGCDSCINAQVDYYRRADGPTSAVTS